LHIAVLLDAVDSVTTQKQNPFPDSKGIPCNINNYDSFFSGPIKKLENIILEMNKKIGQDSEKISDFKKKENHTKGKWKLVSCSSDKRHHQTGRSSSSKSKLVVLR